MSISGGKKLIILEQPVTQFWKDEGGKSNVMRFRLRSPVPLSEPLPLSCDLYYEGGQRVEEAEQRTILSLYRRDLSRLSIPPATGEVCVEFRIEAVSSKKDNRKFCLHVEPDLREAGARVRALGIEGVMSVAIEVFSKRKTGQREVARRVPPLAPPSVEPPEEGTASVRKLYATLEQMQRTLDVVAKSVRRQERRIGRIEARLGLQPWGAGAGAGGGLAGFPGGSLSSLPGGSFSGPIPDLTGADVLPSAGGGAGAGAGAVERYVPLYPVSHLSLMHQHSNDTVASAVSAGPHGAAAAAAAAAEEGGAGEGEHGGSGSGSGSGRVRGARSSGGVAVAVPAPAAAALQPPPLGLPLAGRKRKYDGGEGDDHHGHGASGHGGGHGGAAVAAAAAASGPGAAPAPAALAAAHSLSTVPPLQFMTNLMAPMTAHSGSGGGGGGHGGAESGPGGSGTGGGSGSNSRSHTGGSFSGLIGGSITAFPIDALDGIGSPRAATGSFSFGGGGGSGSVGAGVGGGAGRGATSSSAFDLLPGVTNVKRIRTTELTVDYDLSSLPLLGSDPLGTPGLPPLQAPLGRHYSTSKFFEEYAAAADGPAFLASYAAGQRAAAAAAEGSSSGGGGGGGAPAASGAGADAAAAAEADGGAASNSNLRRAHVQVVETLSDTGAVSVSVLTNDPHYAATVGTMRANAAAAAAAAAAASGTGAPMEQ